MPRHGAAQRPSDLKGDAPALTDHFQITPMPPRQQAAAEEENEDANFAVNPRAFFFCSLL